MSNSFKVACLQVTAGRDVAANIERASAMVREAASAGASLICLPENATLLESDQKMVPERAMYEEEHPGLPAFRSLAKETKSWILIGSLSIRLRDQKRAANRSYLINADGAVTARYDKIHLFDVNLASGESYRESDNFRPGDKAVVAETPWGGLGMTVCYDLRFPHLYRALAKAGASFLSVPSAFTRPTGQAHWHTLLRARAIETGCYVFAPAQCGEHDGGRKTYGHSLIVDPWGEVLADGGEAPGIVYAEVDPKAVETVRARIPCLSHDRDFSL